MSVTEGPGLATTPLLGMSLTVRLLGQIQGQSAGSTNLKYRFAIT